MSIYTKQRALYIVYLKTNDSVSLLALMIDLPGGSVGLQTPQVRRHIVYTRGLWQLLAITKHLGLSSMHSTD